MLFDQRGCGRSTPSVVDPAADLSANTTWHLVADMEVLREHLEIDRWQLFGGSWGATLAMAYAQTAPGAGDARSCCAGCSCCGERELDWMYRGGAGDVFPEAWAAFASLVPSGDTLSATTGWSTIRTPRCGGGRAGVEQLGGRGGVVDPEPGPDGDLRGPERSRSRSRGSRCTTSCTAGWLEPDQLVRDAGKLAGIPGRIVQGRYDAVCPPVTAWELHRAWPDSTLLMLPQAGHAVTDRGVLDALLEATDEFR